MVRGKGKTREEEIFDLNIYRITIFKRISIDYRIDTALVLHLRTQMKMSGRPPDIDWVRNGPEISLAHGEKEQPECTFWTCTLSISLVSRRRFRSYGVREESIKEKMIRGTK